MHQLATNQPHCADMFTLAERELTAFFRAVRELLGPEQAELSVEDWLHELDASERLPASAREWRRITLNALTRLAMHVGASSVSATSFSFA